jgi:hypothetical protein
MELSTKPDFERARAMWRAYWNKDVLKRPLVWATAGRPGAKNTLPRNRKYYHAVTGQYEKELAVIDETLANTLYLGESMPMFSPDHGPDQYATFFGGKLDFAEASPETNWVHPVLNDLETDLPLVFNEESKTWKSLLHYSKLLAEHGKGRYFVSMCDLHSNADTLSALRGPQNFCTDFIDCPEKVGEAMMQVRKTYPKVHEALYQAGGMEGRGCGGWAPFWCEGRYATIQSDFLALISPEHARKYVIPALEEEAEYLDHCVLHFDGPGAIPHLDDVLAIKGIDVIQWVAGAGQPPMWQWTDLLKKCQKAGKGLQIFDLPNAEAVKKVHRELSPEGLLYAIGGMPEKEVADLLAWLEKNT